MVSHRNKTNVTEEMQELRQAAEKIKFRNKDQRKEQQNQTEYTSKLL